MKEYKHSKMIAPHIIWYAIFLHLFWFFALTISETTENITSLNHVVSFFSSRYLTGFFFLIASFSSLYGIWYDKGFPTTKGCMFFLPQLFVFLMAAMSSIFCVYKSAYADGVLRSRWFIASDQMPTILAALTYTYCVLKYYGKGAFRKAKK